MRITLMGGCAAVLAACASIGRPEGGPRDVTPPVYVKSTPAPGATGVDRGRVEIFFDENIKLEDVSNKLVISPAQSSNPQISTNGKRVSVQLRDSLKPNTTYTFDFSDAIRDLNEGNILDGFALDFATGDAIDTLRVSGMVFEARNLEPAQGMVVGVYSNLSDTAIKTLPLERIAKTNQYGQFTIRGLKPGEYKVYALEDRNHDWHWDRSENVAFGSFTVSPSVEPVMVADTLKSSLGEDSIVQRQAYHYLPDDLLLTWFNENYRPQYLREYERTDRKRVTLKFGAESDSLPHVTILNGPRKGFELADLSVIESREGLDSLVYWVKDTVLLHQDSLLVAARYLKTDSLEQLSMTTDTLKLHVRGVKRKDPAKEAREAKKQQEKKRKEAEKRTEQGDSTNVADSVAAAGPQIELLEIKPLGGSSQDLNKPFTFEVAEPVERIDSGQWRVEVLVDTLWKPVPEARMVQDSAMIRRYNVEVPWKGGERYRISLDSLAVTGIYGTWNKDIRQEVAAKTQEDYGNIVFAVSDFAAPNDSAQLMVELLDQQEKVVQARPLGGDGTVTFTYLEPATFYARAFIDRNGNGVWDTGNVASETQPEDVFYYNKKLTLRKNWDIEQDWALFGLPVDEQKPNEIKKNKPKNRDRNAAEPGEEEEEDEYGDGYYDPTNPYGAGDAWGNGSQYNNAKRNNSGSGNRRRNGGMRRNTGL